MVCFPNKYFINLAILLLCGCSSSPYTNESIKDGPSLESNLSYDTFRIFCSGDQHHLTCQWIKDFQKKYQGIHAEVLLYNKSLPPGKLSSEKEGLFLVGKPNIKKISENYWSIKYARDGIVFIINEANPSYKEIMEYGFGIQPFTPVETGKDTRRWSKLSGSEQTRPIKVFVCSDSLSTCKVLTDYLKIDPDESKIVITEKVQDIIDSVTLDPLSMGLCCQRYAYDLIRRTEIPAIKIIHSTVMAMAFWRKRKSSTIILINFEGAMRRREVI